jgi:ABC-type nickel/cobalt efflux system permease component RcnA
MLMELLIVLGIGFSLGLRHTFDADHIIAVSTIASRTGNLFRATMSGLYRGIGHTLTLFVIGLIFVSLKIYIPEKVALSMEMVVGIMLVILGWTTFNTFKKRKVHVHIHQHKDEKEEHIHYHSHVSTETHQHEHISKPERKSFLVGMIHGLAAGGALVLLLMPSMNSIAEAALYITVFGSGTIVGMILFAFVIGLPFVLLAKRAAFIERRLGMIAGIFSISFGLFFMFKVAFLEGLFLF